MRGSGQDQFPIARAEVPCARRTRSRVEIQANVDEHQETAPEAGAFVVDTQRSTVRRHSMKPSPSSSRSKAETAIDPTARSRTMPRWWPESCPQNRACGAGTKSSHRELAQRPRKGSAVRLDGRPRRRKASPICQGVAALARGGQSLE